MIAPNPDQLRDNIGKFAVYILCGLTMFYFRFIFMNCKIHIRSYYIYYLGMRYQNIYFDIIINIILILSTCLLMNLFVNVASEGIYNI